MKRGDPILVRWRDSTSIYGWKNPEEVEKVAAEGPLICDAVGFFVSETADSICLCSQMSPHQCSDLIIVPKESITKQKVLK